MTIKRVLAAAALVAGLAAACTPAKPTPAALPLPIGVTFVSNPLHGPITVQDDTAGTYPVAAAVAAWGVPVRFGTCTVDGGWCIRLEPVPTLGGLLEPGVLGLSQQFPPLRVTWLTLPATTPEPLRAQVVCHELGHAFGLGHDVTGGCMYAATSGAYPRPSAADLAMIRRDYQ